MTDILEARFPKQMNLDSFNLNHFKLISDSGK